MCSFSSKLTGLRGVPVPKQKTTPSVSTTSSADSESTLYRASPLADAEARSADKCSEDGSISVKSNQSSGEQATGITNTRIGGRRETQIANDTLNFHIGRIYAGAERQKRYQNVSIKRRPKKSSITFIQVYFHLSSKENLDDHL